MKTKTVNISVVYTIGGVLTMKLPASMTLEQMQTLVELQLENEGLTDNTIGFKLKNREYDASIYAVTDGES